MLLCVALNSRSENVDNALSGLSGGEVAGHEYVDLGLPSGTLWATSNLGADSQYKPGEYFAWGETEARELFQWTDYKFFIEEYADENGSHSYSATEIGEDISGSEYDAACYQWGHGWRTPTQDEWEELIAYCHQEFKGESLSNPKYGLYLWGPNGNNICLPETFSPHNGISLTVSHGEYWSATANSNLSGSGSPSAMMLTFNPADSKLQLIANGRHDGLSIRPVISRKDVSTSVGMMSETHNYMRYENGEILISDCTEGCQLYVADLSGRCILDSPINDKRCQLPGLTKGIYLVSLNKDDKSLSTIKISVK